MLPVIAVPVIHSSGAWIASTAASGYLAGTLSSTWVGAFILGNSGLLGSLGLVSAGGIFAAGGGLAALTATVGTAAGSTLTAVGLGGLAKSLGLVPATFLGLTPVGWAIAGTTTVGLGGASVLLLRTAMKSINEERVSGGLPPTTLKGIVDEIRQFEYEATVDILRQLSKERLNFKLSRSAGTVDIEGQTHKIRDVVYVVNDDGSEELRVKRRLRRAQGIFQIKGPNEGNELPAASEPA